jgi:hypothetical protein
MLRIGRPVSRTRSSPDNAPAEAELCSIDDALRDHFAPAVRRAGFTGSGRNFRKLAGPLVLVVNVQGSMAGGKFCVNLGIHPVALFDGQPRKIKEHECLLRQRLAEDGQADQWWNYGNDGADAVEAAKAAARLFEEKGVRLLDAQAGSDAPLLTITAEQYSTGENFSGFRSGFASTALALGRLRKLSGDASQAIAFAKVGLGEVGERAVGLRRDLEALATSS